jgi:hypothetical protein
VASRSEGCSGLSAVEGVAAGLSTGEGPLHHASTCTSLLRRDARKGGGEVPGSAE